MEHYQINRYCHIKGNTVISTDSNQKMQIVFDQDFTIYFFEKKLKPNTVAIVIQSKISHLKVWKHSQYKITNKIYVV